MIPWPDGPSNAQSFSLPDTAIFYILKNPSTPKAYNKLIQSCKACFEKNPILVATYISDYSNSLKICSNEFNKCIRSCCVQIALDKILSKIWLTEKIILYYNKNIPNDISLLVSKIFRCKIDEFVLYTNFTVAYNDLKLFAPSLKKISLHDVKTTYDDGSTVMIENIIELIPNLESFYYTFRSDILGANDMTMRKILELKNLGNLKFFRLQNVPGILDANDLTEFVMAGDYEGVYIVFCDDIPQAYKIKLDALVDTIISSHLYKCVIYYPGQDRQKLEIMQERDHD